MNDREKEQIRQKIQQLEQQIINKRKALAANEKRLVKIGNEINEMNQELQIVKVEEQKAKENLAILQKVHQILID